jgi:hypothetical protein
VAASSIHAQLLSASVKCGWCSVPRRCCLGRFSVAALKPLLLSNFTPGHAQDTRLNTQQAAGWFTYLCWQQCMICNDSHAACCFHVRCTAGAGPPPGQYGMQPPGGMPMAKGPPSGGMMRPPGMPGPMGPAGGAPMPGYGAQQAAAGMQQMSLGGPPGPPVSSGTAVVVCLQDGDISARDQLMTASLSLRCADGRCHCQPALSAAGADAVLTNM